MKTIVIQDEEELPETLKTICKGIVYQYLFLNKQCNQLVLWIYKESNKLCLNVMDESSGYELELRVTYHSEFKESKRRVNVL